MTAAPEGNALRAAARDLADRFPRLHIEVLARLNALAVRYDTELMMREQRQALARREQAARMDTRGRWVRRTQSNTGPGVSGVGHIATAARRTPLNDSEGLCGVTLRGGLEWGHRAVDTSGPDAGWRSCRACLRALDMPALRGAA